jgi:Tol biopolymer transport system component
MMMATACLLAVVALPDAASAVLSGANGRIVFSSGRIGPDNGNAKLFLRLTTGSFGGPPLPAGQVPLDATNGQHRHPTWSPDRTHIAYARGDSGCATNCDIYTLDLTDENATPVNITNTPTITEDRPAWSPDGTRIAYESENGTQVDILVDTEPFGSGANLTLANDPKPEGKPAWTPNSQTLYYSLGDVNTTPPNGNNNDARIMREPADNSGTPAEVLHISGAHVFQPSISPDGSQMCFTTATAPGFTTTAGILVAPISSPASFNVLASSGTGDYNCTWSPDGTQIAYVEGFAGPGDLVMKRADGSTGPVAIDLETSAGWDGNPDWAPDARPQCEDQTITTTVDTPVEIPLLCADRGPDYERTDVNAIATGGPTNGTVSPEDAQVVPASVTYTPNLGFSGKDTFTVRSFDAVTFGDRNGTVTVNVNKPSNEFSFGKLKKNKRKGTAKLTVNVPGPGEVELAKSKKVKPDGERAASQGAVELRVKPKRKAKAKLAKNGKAKVKLTVSYTPDKGDRNTKTKRVKLVRRR